MKQIVLKQLSLLNFKGIEKLTVDFTTSTTTIGGANGTGKTSVFDAFMWLLFGKDSKDRKDFEIKTIGADGKAIPRLPHEVSAILDVDGAEIKLRKTYSEKWTKRRGAIEEVFDGHEVECFWQDVPLRATEYATRIAEICPEQTFKLITNPLYFTAQKPDMQRQLLFRLAGDVTDTEIVAANPNKEFEEVLKLLSGKTANDLKREIASKKKIIKEAIESIPARIDERKRATNAPQDWSALQNSIVELQNELQGLNLAITERTKVYDAATAEKRKLAKYVSDLQVFALKRKNELQKQLTADYYQRKQEYDKAHTEVTTLLNQKQNYELSKKLRTTELTQKNSERNRLLTIWKTIQAETLNIDENEFVCPVCHRPFEADEIESKKAKLELNFNADKARRLEQNKAQGIAVKEQIENLNAQLAELDDKIYECDVQIKAIENSQEYICIPQMPADIDDIIKSDGQMIDINSKIAVQQAKIDEEITAPNCTDLLDKRGQIENSLREAQVQLAGRDVVESNLKRIAELENEYRSQQEELTNLEHIEFQINEFTKARTQAIEQRVNSMFHFVKFKLFDTLVNGSEVETCEATVDGVPFSTLNQARQMNAGLDIINTICEKENISAPIVIDNRESITEITAPSQSQIINLEVHPECKVLTIL